ncbi:MAG: hypothetical protein ACXWCG_13060 [Flavitalea sp.]
MNLWFGTVTVYNKTVTVYNKMSKLTIMQTPTNNLKKAQKSILCFSGFLLLIVIFFSFAIVRHELINKQDCPIKEKNSNAMIEVNEMLFSIKSFSLYD